MLEVTQYVCMRLHTGCMSTSSFSFSLSLSLSLSLCLCLCLSLSLSPFSVSVSSLCLSLFCFSLSPSLPLWLLHGTFVTAFLQVLATESSIVLICARILCKSKECQIIFFLFFREHMRRQSERVRESERGKEWEREGGGERKKR
jgi:hypothetical protein